MAKRRASQNRLTRDNNREERELRVNEMIARERRLRERAQENAPRLPRKRKR